MLSEEHKQTHARPLLAVGGVVSWTSRDTTIPSRQKIIPFNVTGVKDPLSTPQHVIQPMSDDVVLNDATARFLYPGRFPSPQHFLPPILSSAHEVPFGLQARGMRPLPIVHEAPGMRFIPFAQENELSSGWILVDGEGEVDSDWEDVSSPF